MFARKKYRVIGSLGFAERIQTGAVTTLSHATAVTQSP